MAKSVKPRRPREMPGLALLLSQVPEDVRRELADQQPLFIAGFAIGWLRAAAERIASSGSWNEVDEPPVEPSRPAPVPSVSASQQRVAQAPLDPSLPPPPGPQEPAIGHWTPLQVTEIIGFAVVNSTNSAMARTLAVRKLREWDTTHADLPGSWAAQILFLLERPAEGARSIRREPSLDQIATAFDETQQPQGEFAQLAEAADAS